MNDAQLTRTQRALLIAAKHITVDANMCGVTEECSAQLFALGLIENPDDFSLTRRPIFLTRAGRLLVEQLEFMLEPGSKLELPPKIGPVTVDLTLVEAPEFSKEAAVGIKNHERALDCVFRISVEDAKRWLSEAHSRARFFDLPQSEKREWRRVTRAWVKAIAEREGYVCDRCKDEHTVWDSRYDHQIPCTACPTPCRECASGSGKGAFCDKTSCPCECH